MKAYSIDLRQRIVAAVERGMRHNDVAATFEVSRSTIKRLLARKRRNATDELAATPPPGRPRTVQPEHHAAVWAQLEAHPDATIAAHTQLWNAAQGAAVSQWTVGRAIRRVGWTRKKSRWQPPSATSRLERRIGNR